MRLARAYGAPAKLGECCAHFGVPLTEAHAALADAEAAAGLLAAYIAASGSRREWDGWLAPPPRGVAPVLRGTTRPGSAVLARAVGHFAPVDDVDGADEYLDLLDRVLLDRKISVPERRALEGMATTLGLGAGDVARLNRHYMLGVVDAVCADDQLTREERALVIQLAGLLDLADLEVEGLLAAAQARVATVIEGVELKPGDLVVFTGFPEARKAQLREVAEARGLVVWPGVKKGVAAVIAQDPGSGSGKARKAREYGIPVVGEGALS
jgi:DNA polymerase-3 subunit epsilon